MTPHLKVLAATAGIASLVAIAAVPASAALGVSVVKDPWNIAQTTATVQKLADQYRTMVDHLAEARAQVSALTSHSGAGDLLNGPAERAARRYLPDAWAAATDVRDATSAVNGAAYATRGLIDDATALYRPASATEIDPHRPDSDEGRRYEKEVGTALAVLAGSQVMLDATAKRRDAYEGLMARIETAPDAKAAADLNNRLAAENGLTQNELVRATAMQAHVAAVQEMRLAAARADSARAAIRTRVNLSGGTYTPAS